MGKKHKIGKARKDKFYELAKETGFRSRAAFKLLQLNRKFQFLGTSRVILDLCAAPGGWSQVAIQQAPVGALVLAVDLVPIRAIHNVLTFQEDITTERCRSTIKNQLKTFHVDCVLNDGAPNVGKNWTHDAFSQAQLTLSALKLASNFMREGAWFITKVFRSKDYNSLIWTFQQLFKEVHVTKPQASRSESAEIFVICRGYLSPTKLDSTLFDPTYVFADSTLESSGSKKRALNLLHPEKQKKHRSGYNDGEQILFHSLDVDDFISSPNYLELLANSNTININIPEVVNHPLTTQEILHCCSDIKVLGKSELRLLVKWRNKLRKIIDDAVKHKKGDENKANEISEVSVESNDECDAEIMALKATDDKEKRKLRRQQFRNKRKIRERLRLEMEHPEDPGIQQVDDIALFDLSCIGTSKQLRQLTEETRETMDVDSALLEQERFEDETKFMTKPSKFKTYSREFDPEYEEYDDKRINESDENEESHDVDAQWSSEEEEPEDVLATEKIVKSEPSVDSKANSGLSSILKRSKQARLKNPLLIDFESDKIQKERQVEQWFNRPGFVELFDKNPEIASVLNGSKNKVTDIMEKALLEETDNVGLREYGAAVKSVHIKPDKAMKNKSAAEINSKLTVDKSKDSFEVVRQEESSDVKPLTKFNLTPEELALGAKLINSAKDKRDLIEWSYNRYMHDDHEYLPDWFVEDEKKHFKSQLPITKEEVQIYRDRLKALNARPIKKIAEAKARKKRRALKKLERLRKKAENISDTLDVTDQEKSRQIRDIYKKAGMLNKSNSRDVTYVFAKKGTGKKVIRPKGVKGRFRVVDSRMKKDELRRKSAVKGKHGKKIKKTTQRETSRKKSKPKTPKGGKK